MITMEGYQYRNGNAATILKTDLKNACPVVSTDGARVFYHRNDGAYFEGDSTRLRIEGEVHPLDLVPIPEPQKYVPFTLADWKQFIGKVVVSKNGEWIRTLDNACLSYATGMLYQSLFTDYTFEDGSIVGKLA